MEQSSKQLSKILQKSKLFVFISLLIFLAACSSDFKKTLSEVALVDAENGADITYYNNGLSYFDTHERDVALNAEDFDRITAELESMKQGKSQDSLNYLDFRIKLFEAEKLYKMSTRVPFASFNEGVIRCSKRAEINQSINIAFQAINKTEEAITLYANLGKNADLTGIAPEWVERTRASNAEITEVLDSGRAVITNYCNSTLPELS